VARGRAERVTVGPLKVVEAGDRYPVLGFAVVLRPGRVRGDGLRRGELGDAAQPDLSARGVGPVADRLGEAVDRSGGAVVGDEDADGHAELRFRLGRLGRLGKGRGRRDAGQSTTVTVLSEVFASMPAWPSSRPCPLSFAPPQGRRGSSGDQPFTATAPAFTRRARVWARERSAVHSVAASA